MTAREYMEKNFGKRPHAAPAAQLTSKVRLLKLAATRAQKECRDAELWDARFEVVQAIWRTDRHP